MLCRAYTVLVTSGSFLRSFLNTTVSVILEHVWESTESSAQNPSMDSCPTQSKSPSFFHGSEPCYLSNCVSPTLPPCSFTVVSLVQISMLPPPCCCSLYSLPKVFNGRLPPLISGLSLEVTLTARLSMSSLHSPPILPDQQGLPHFAGLFLCHSNSPPTLLLSIYMFNDLYLKRMYTA